MLEAKAVEDFRPEWLDGLEIDIAFLDLDIAIEFQGDQHYVPVYGYSQLQSQRRNDVFKKRVCEDRGIAFIRIDAIDLEWTRIRHKLKAAAKRARRRWFMSSRDRATLRRLNAEATRYRATLRDTYQSPTARRRGKTRKQQKREWRMSNGCA